MSTASERWVEPAEPTDLRELVVQLWAARLWIAASAVLFAVGAAVLAFTSTPIYRASAVLVPASSERSGMGAGLGSALGQLGGLASIAGINVNGSDIETEEALAVLRSRQFTEAFINDKQLMPKLFARKWDSARKQWKSGETPPTSAQANRYFDDRVRSVTQDKKTGLMTLQVDWRDRNEAAEWANELVQRLNAEMRKRAIAKTGASVGYLEQELHGTTIVTTREAISRLIEAQVKQRMLANVTQEYAFRLVDRAMAPDANDPIRPKKPMLIAVGTVLGAGFGMVAVLFIRWVRAGRASSRPDSVP